MPLITQALFFEMTSPEDRKKRQPKYTLKDNDHTVDGIKYLSLHKVYMKTADLTEYQFVMKTIGSWKHWKRLCELKWFQPYVNSWREELEVKLRSEGIRAVIDNAMDVASGSSASSAKWVAEKGWEKGTGKGRPSSSTIKKEANKMIRIDEELEEDLIRMESMH